MGPNNRSHFHSHATAWTVSIAGALVLYVLTWPLLQILCSQPAAHVPSHPLPRGYFHVECPAAVTNFYRPLYTLLRVQGGDNPLNRYWLWWGDFMKRKVIIPA